ncbi:MAG: glycosyltransferase family 9 protein [Deltaproteobacteria bacterium]|nr:glycosyltransferase family 9 protein [Deltaproteobacteria bacterium]
MASPRSILVIKMSSLGDVIHAVPAAYDLRSLFPESEIHWVVDNRFKDLLPGPPWIDSQVIFDKKALKGRKAFKGLLDLRRDLRSKKPDLVIDLQGNLKSSLVAVLSGCRNRIGYWEMREGSFLFTKPVFGPNQKGHVIERYRDVIRSLGPIASAPAFQMPDYSKEAESAREKLSKLGFRKPPAIIFPGTSWVTKQWPAELYALLAKGLSDHGIEVAVGGSDLDKHLTEAVIEMAKPLDIRDLTGSATLRGLMGLVSQAALCIGSDTGPMHMASAVGTPTVALFGPTSGARTGVIGPRAINVSTTAECAPCFKRICPKEFICMGLIEPGKVLEACLKALGLKSGAQEAETEEETEDDPAFGPWNGKQGLEQ